MKKIILSAAMLFLALVQGTAQNNETNQTLRKNAVFWEAGGSAVWYSLNYEHRVSLKTDHRLTFGGGLSWLPVPLTKNGVSIGVLSVGYLYGNRHILETGISWAYLFSQSDSAGSIRIGYRYEGPKGFLFRAGFSPLYTKVCETGFKEYDGKSFFPWAYLSFGYTF